MARRSMARAKIAFVPGVLAAGGRVEELLTRAGALATAGEQPSTGGERFGGQADALAHELARAPGDRGRERDPEHGHEHDERGPAGSAHRPAAGNSSTATAPPPGRFPSLASPCQARARVLAIARPRPLPAGPCCPARPRWKRSNTSSSSPGARPGPRSRTSMRPSPPASVTSPPAGRVAQRVLDQHVQRPVEVGARAPCGPRALAGRLQRDLARLGGGTPALHARADGAGQVDALALQLAVLAAAQHEQLVDDRRETVDLGGPGVELGGDPGANSRGARLLQTQPQRGQRRAQLMGGVGDELALGADQPLRRGRPSR